jgi:hypothetical protein
MYGEYLTAEAVADLVRSSISDLERVKAWIGGNGIATDVCELHNGDVLRCRATVTQLETLLDTELFTLVQTGSGSSSLTHFGSLTVPNDISDCIDLIQGLSFIPFRKAGHHEGADALAEEHASSFESFVESRSHSHPRFAGNRTPHHAAVLLEEGETCPASSPRPCSTSSGVSVRAFTLLVHQSDL